MDELIAVARQWIGIARYNFWEEFCRPPRIVNCYLFTHWVFGECGISLPSTLMGQLYVGDLAEGDCRGGELMLVFLGGCRWGGYYDNGRARDGVGHVGILTPQRTVIHASQKAKGVEEVPYQQFVHPARRFRGVYKIKALA